MLASFCVKTFPHAENKIYAEQISKPATETKAQPRSNNPKMKPTLLLLSVIAIALLSCAEARLGWNRGPCACPAVEPRWCGPREEPRSRGCCGFHCVKWKKEMKSEKNRAGWPAGWPGAPFDEEEEGLGLDNFDRSMWDETEDEEVGSGNPSSRRTYSWMECVKRCKVITSTQYSPWSRELCMSRCMRDPPRRPW